MIIYSNSTYILILQTLSLISSNPISHQLVDCISNTDKEIIWKFINNFFVAKMEDRTTIESLSITEYDGLPSLNSDNKPIKPFVGGRQRQVRLKALSLPINFNPKSGSLKASYKVSEHYNLMEKLGFGAYSEVRRGIHKKTEEVFAVKISKGTTS